MEEHGVMADTNTGSTGRASPRKYRAPVLTAAELIAETGDVGRFRSPDAFAALPGGHHPCELRSETAYAPEPWPQPPDRPCTPYRPTVQATHHAPAQASLLRKQAKRKTRREAIRALKRQPVRTLFRQLRGGAEGLQMAG